MYISTEKTRISNNSNQDRAITVSETNSSTKNLAIMGCGYVGVAIARHWRQEENTIITATTTTPKRVSELEEVADQVLTMGGDNLEAVNDVVNNQDTILLTIAPTSNTRVDAETYRKTYIPTAENLQLALQNNTTVKQIIYLSSCSVYGNQEGKWVDETSPLKIENEYSEVLSEAEEILLKLADDNIKVCILRLGGIYGPGRELNERFKKLAGKTLSGSGDNLIAWIHLEDIIGAVDFVHKNKLGGIYNLVNDLNLTTKQILDKICDQQGLEKVSWDPSETGFTSLNARISNQKLKAAGYRLIHSDTIV
jgi:nucleoside-diphosphate-sugar epimerase